MEKKDIRRQRKIGKCGFRLKRTNNINVSDKLKCEPTV